MEKAENINILKDPLVWVLGIVFALIIINFGNDRLHQDNVEQTCPAGTEQYVFTYDDFDEYDEKGERVFSLKNLQTDTVEQYYIILNKTSLSLAKQGFFVKSHICAKELQPNTLIVTSVQ